MRKIILNLAVSLDGYIADIKGGYDWIVGDGDSSLDTEQKWDFQTFLEQIDVVVMGKNCYDQNMHLDFKDKKVYVATSKKLPSENNITFINDDICTVIQEERQRPGKDIYLFGGGVLIDYFLKDNLIDEFVIGVIPTILGHGRPLFLGHHNKIDLHLENYYCENGIIVMRYTKK